MEIAIEDAQKAYDGKVVLDHFSLRLPQIGAVCLFGPSGCGKTTLLNILSGLEPLDGGCVALPKEARICRVFQEDRLLPWISARENIELVLPNGKHRRKTADAWLEAVGLEGEEERLPGELSGGMRQRVSLARALAFGGDVFLLDEPFHALDPETKTRLMRLIQQETKRSLLLLVTHDPKEAQQLADCILYADGPPLKIREKHDLK